MATQTELLWLTTENDYQLAIDEGRIVARNPKGRNLKSVPAAVQRTTTYAELDALLGWLAAHEKTCADTVEAWLLRSLPVPTAVIAEVWPDEAWRRQLQDLVITDGTVTGFLRDAIPAVGAPTNMPRLGVVDLDGESATIDAELITILHREVITKPDPLPDPAATRLTDWADAKFDQLRFAAARARSAGFAVKGGFAVARVHEHGRLIEASYWIGADAPDWETWTGELSWIADGTTLPLGEVGPVAWSEGVRMARHIHAGRTIEKDEDDQ